MLNLKKKPEKHSYINFYRCVADEAMQVSSSKHVQLSVPILESVIHDQPQGLVPSTSASFEQSCQLADQSELQLEPATTEEPNTTKQSEVHLEPAGTEQLHLQIEPATTELQFQLNGHTTKLIFSSEPEPETESKETDLETSFYVSQDEA